MVHQMFYSVTYKNTKYTSSTVMPCNTTKFATLPGL